MVLLSGTGCLHYVEGRNRIFSSTAFRSSHATRCWVERERRPGWEVAHCCRQARRHLRQHTRLRPLTWQQHYRSYDDDVRGFAPRCCLECTNVRRSERAEQLLFFLKCLPLPCRSDPDPLSLCLSEFVWGRLLSSNRVHLLFSWRFSWLVSWGILCVSISDAIRRESGRVCAAPAGENIYTISTSNYVFQTSCTCCSVVNWEGEKDADVSSKTVRNTALLCRRNTCAFSLLRLSGKVGSGNWREGVVLRKSLRNQILSHWSRRKWNSKPIEAKSMESLSFWACHRRQEIWDEVRGNFLDSLPHRRGRNRIPTCAEKSVFWSFATWTVFCGGLNCGWIDSDSKFHTRDYKKFIGQISTHMHVLGANCEQTERKLPLNGCVCLNRRKAIILTESGDSLRKTSLSLLWASYYHCLHILHLHYFQCALSSHSSYFWFLLLKRFFLPYFRSTPLRNFSFAPHIQLAQRWYAITFALACVVIAFSR